MTFTSSIKGKLALYMTGIAFVSLFSFFASSAHAASTDYTFLIRGIVKPGGDLSSINLYTTHASSRAKVDLAGNRQDISVTTAKKYKWVKNSKGVLVKKRVSSNPTPDTEVVVKGAKKSNGTFVALWVVENYREFTVNGKVKKVEIDTGSSDEGWITARIGNSTYKQAKYAGKDVRFRFNGLSTLTALGKSKGLDELSESNQSVKLKGKINGSSTWTLSKVWEI